MMRNNIITSKKTIIITVIFLVLLSFTSSFSYYEDFEVSNGGYIPEPPTGVWQWGVPTVGPNSAHSGTKVWGTGFYPNYCNASLTTFEFIVNDNNPVLKFWQWYFISTGDGGNVKISANNGITWTTIYPIGGYPGQSGVSGESCYAGYSPTWTEAVFQLPLVSGQRFIIRWQFFSDSEIVGYGWYLDDVTGIGFTQPPQAVNDVGVQMILSPSKYHLQFTPMTPLARIKNYGILNQTNVPVVCSIVGPNNTLRYTNTQTINIGSGETLRVYFTPWTPTSNEVCTVKVRTSMVNDEVPSNDRFMRTTTIMSMANIYIGNATTNARVEPLDRYYNYNTHEALYLQSEIDVAGTISQIGYYKHSGSNIDPIMPVTIYMKQTTDMSLSSGLFLLTGYTQVFSGEFPNNGISGWLDVQLSTPFQFSNTSNLQMLIFKGYQPYISTGYPYWRYTTSSRYLTRGARSDSNQPSYLVQTYNRPNIRLRLVPVGIEESNNSKNIPIITALYVPKPNPITNNRTQISFSLAEPSQVSLKIYDASGKIVRTLFNNQQLTTNNYSLIWNCQDNTNRKVGQGVYFVSLETPKQKLTKKLVIAK